jgi:hypothetical protein
MSMKLRSALALSAQTTVRSRNFRKRRLRSQEVTRNFFQLKDIQVALACLILCCCCRCHTLLLLLCCCCAAAVLLQLAGILCRAARFEGRAQRELSALRKNVVVVVLSLASLAPAEIAMPVTTLRFFSVISILRVLKIFIRLPELT